MSILRKKITDISARYIGAVAVTGEVSDYKTSCRNFRNICGEDKIIAKNEPIFFLSQPKTNGELYYYACFQQPES